MVGGAGVELATTGVGAAVALLATWVGLLCALFAASNAMMQMSTTAIAVSAPYICHVRFERVRSFSALGRCDITSDADARKSDRQREQNFAPVRLSVPQFSQRTLPDA